MPAGSVTTSCSPFVLIHDCIWYSIIAAQHASRTPVSFPETFSVCEMKRGQGWVEILFCTRERVIASGR